MRKTVLLLVMLIVGVTTSVAQDMQEIVYLKNGSAIKGIVIEQIPDKSLKLKTSDGSVFVFQMEEVDKIVKKTKEEVMDKAEKVSEKGLNMFQISWRPELQNENYINSLALGYTRGIEFTIPFLYMEAGINGVWAFQKEYGAKFNMISVDVPLSFGCKLNVGNDNWIIPLLGLNAKCHIWGNMSYEGNSWNIFSENDMDYLKFNRFHLGWHVGVRGIIDKVTAAITYGTDFTKLNDSAEEKVHQFTISLGYRF